MKFLATCALAAGLACAARGAPSLKDEYSHRVWRVQDGLPQNRIQVISQTRDGYLWIGTSGGLARFDGARFHLFDRSNTAAIGDDSILSLYPSKDGSLWIGTEGGGLLHYRQGRFEVIGPEQGLTNRFVRAVHEDGRGRLWIGTDRGFFRLDSGRIARLDNTGGVPLMAVRSIREDRNGRLWITTGAGLMVVDEGIIRPYLLDGKPLEGVLGVHESRQGGLWIRTRDGLRRLENGALTGNHRFDGISASALWEDTAGNLWIGTLGEGLIRAGGGTLTTFHGPGDLPSNAVWSIYGDREQNLWVGTHDGLVRLAPASVRTIGARDGLADDNVSSVYEDRAGVLWLTTLTGRIYRFADGKLHPYPLPAPHRDARARTVFVDSRRVLWIGTLAHGVLRVSGGAVKNYSTAEGLRNNSVRQFLEDRGGGIWIALGSGLSRWDGERFENYYIEDGLPYGSVRVLLEDHSGDILVGTDGGLSRIRAGKFVPDDSFDGLAGEKIYSLYQDEERTLWVGTRGGGLFRVRGGKAARITIADGLLSNAIFQILEDGGRNLWFSSPAGVFSTTRDELNRVADGMPGPIAIVPHGIADGMESVHMNGSIGWGGWRTASGHLWFASVKGAVRIDPNHRRVLLPPPVVVESVSADDRPIPISGEIRIAPGSGKLEIDYTACSLLFPERISFRYMLEGVDKTWVATNSRRSAYYTNLSPGRYRFRVMATDSAIPRNASEASVAFLLEPHFYQTGWFYALGAALAALAGWLAFQIYARHTKARYALLLAERTRLAREMHDTIIQGCVGVSTLLEAASGFERIDTGRMNQLLDHARAQLRLTLDEARQAVWNLRQAGIENDIAGALGDFARQLSTEKGVPIEVEIAGSPPHFEEQTLRTVLLVAREAIRNAANHANPRRIHIRMAFENNEARLEVIDDGRGFEPSSALARPKGHYGIIGMRERVQELGGDFQLRSSPGHGTTVIVRLPVKEAV